MLTCAFHVVQVLPASPVSRPTHMFLNGDNLWTLCALISMISIELCDVCADGVGRDVPSALMAAFDADLAGKHVAHVASKAKFLLTQAHDAAETTLSSSAAVATDCWSSYRKGRTTLMRSPKKLPQLPHTGCMSTLRGIVSRVNNCFMRLKSSCTERPSFRCRSRETRTYCQTPRCHLVKRPRPCLLTYIAL